MSVTKPRGARMKGAGSKEFPETQRWCPGNCDGQRASRLSMSLWGGAEQEGDSLLALRLLGNKGIETAVYQILSRP